MIEIALGLQSVISKINKKREGERKQKDKKNKNAHESNTP